MQFFTTIALLSATAAVEAQRGSLPPAAFVKRDIGPLNTVLGQVLEGLNSLNQVANTYSGGPGGDIKSGIDNTLVTVKSATSTCNKLGVVAASEAESFRPTAAKLTDAGDKLIVVLDSKVPIFERNHICGPVLGWLGNLGENVGTLMTAVGAKFPTNSSAAEIDTFKGKFATLGNKLSACSGNATATGVTNLPAESTHKAETVPHSGAGSIGAPAGVLALAAAAAAAILL